MTASHVPGRQAEWSVRGLALLLGVATATFTPFIAIILAERGLSVPAIGLVTSLGSLAALISAPAWGHLSDTRLGPARSLQILALGGALTVLLINLDVPPSVVGLLFIASVGIGSGPWSPLTDALIIRVFRPGNGYARVRMLTSFAYAVGTIGAGVVYAVAGYSAALLVFPALALIYFLVAGVAHRAVGPALERHEPVPLAGAAPPVAGTATGASVADAPTGDSVLGVVRQLGAFLAVTSLVFLGYNASETYFGLRVVELGGNAAQVAASASIAAFAEIPAMLAAGWLAIRYGPRAGFSIACSLFALAFTVWAVATDVNVLLASKLVGGLAYGCLLISGVLAVRMLVSPHRQATGQTVFRAVCYGLVAIAANGLGGALHVYVGFSGFFAMSAVLAVCAAIAGWRFYPARPEPVVREPGL